MIRSKRTTFRRWICLSLLALGGMVQADEAAGGKAGLHLCAPADNDLYRVLTENKVECARHDTALQAVAAAAPGSGVMILADGYPRQTTRIDPAVFEQARKKRLRLFVEFPASLPDGRVGPIRHTGLERAVVASDAFGEGLRKMSLLAIHDCHFVEMEAEEPHLVLAKVAGYDTAAYGLKGIETFPLLFEHPNGRVMVSATKLSQFVTARYAPREGMQAVWQAVFRWLRPDEEPPVLEWTPTVRPTYSRDAELPADAVRQAVIRQSIGTPRPACC